MSAWRVNYLISKEIRNCVADTESVGSLSVLPVAETYGFYLSTNGLADNVSNYHNTSASNYYYGFRMEEHGSWDKLTAFTCVSGLYITGSRAHPIVGGGSFLNQWCQYGITFAGSKYVDINYYAERWDTGGNPSKWFDKIADIYFPSTQAVDGIIKGVATRANDPTEEPIVISGVYTGNLQINDIASNGTKIKMATSEYSEIQNTNSAGSLNSYKQNDRGSFASYFGTLYGGSASVGTLFGLGYADRMFLFTGGASNLGMAIGTISSQPLVFGTDNTERFRIGPAGQWGLSGANYGTSGQFLQTTGSGGAPVWAAPFVLTTTGTSGAATYTGGTLNIPQYTGGGGGITNGAASNELMKSDGTNAVASGLSSSTAGNIDLGLSGTSGSTRSVTANGSASDVGISLIAKGSGTMIISTNDATDGIQLKGNAGNAFINTQTTSSIIGGTDTGTGGVNNALKVRHDITGTPTAGSGAGIELESETSSSNYEVGATIEAVTTDVTSTSEDFDLVFKTMTAGATATEKLRVTSTGNVYVKHGAGSFQLNGLVESVVLAGTSLTLDDDTHRGKVIYCTSGSAVTITVPSGLPLGFTCTIIQDGGGTVSLSASGTTLHGKVASTAQYDAITINYYKSSETYIGF